ncbi:MAG: DUF5763 domain-containing protein [Caldilineaceae bacterium]|nr:DUF5763 domain-containing protein [Caldilineaceae bacterium]
MPRKLCKALRKDGQPCQGLGQAKLDGYCIAHAPADKVWAWRSRGGKASSTAARADKRMPDRLRGTIEKLTKGMDDLIAGEIDPAALSALSRAARVLVNLYRLSDEEMDLIRAEESAAAAAQVSGGLGDPALLEQADAIAAWQNQYTIDALIRQGLVTLLDEETQDANGPPVIVLTASGRQRFRYQRLTTYTQENIDELKTVAGFTDTESAQLPAVLVGLHKIRTPLEELLTDSAPGSPPVLDPLTGQALSQLPYGVKPATVPVAGPEEAEQAVQELQDLLRNTNEAIEEVEAVYQKQFGSPFDIRDELPEEDSD